ncbi:MAG TPA: VIT1/CCC1 transporter family protein [Acidimicrobiales bacterium]|nr:VIT1/CCC1 transporter family protein [Acidimicrobiales bacterium]
MTALPYGTSRSGADGIAADGIAAGGIAAGGIAAGAPLRTDPGPTDQSGDDVPAEMHPHTEHHHRNVQGGAARAAVFGVSDGLVTNVSLILGVAGGQAGASFVRLAGLAGLLAGAFSMAAGEYVSMSAQSELLHRELDIERRALHNEPEAEQEELAQVYQRRGLSPEAARSLAEMMMRTPELALQAHAREEIGVDPSSIASPYPAAISSFASFCVGAVVPLMPWFFIGGTAAVVASVGLVAVTAVILGILLAQATGRPAWRSAARQVLVSMLAAGVTYGVGRLVGVGVRG